MIIALPIVSLLCAALLGFCYTGSRVCADVAEMSLIAWLIVCNLIRGVNSLVWDNSTNIHIPVWCDIVTKVSLAATVALPACCFCLAAHLELMASNRVFSDSIQARRGRMVFSIVVCWIVPIMYLLLHFIAQNHRFDIVRDYGCFAAFHTSIPAAVIIWIPPFIFCLAAFIFCGLSIHHSFRHTAARFEEHILTRSSMSASLYFRRIITVLILAMVNTILILFTLFQRSGSQPWISWESVHQFLRKIFVVNITNDLRLMWWSVPVVSIVYLILSLAFGEDFRDGVKGLRKAKIPDVKMPFFKMFDFRQPRDGDALPVHRELRPVATSTSPASPKSTPEPVLISGWDDMLNVKSPKSIRPKSPHPSSTTSRDTPSSYSEQSRASSSASNPHEDDAFAASTMEYLSSPTAMVLGLQSPVLTPPSPVARSPTRPSRPSRDEHESLWPMNVAKLKAVPDDVASTVSSIYDIPWPHPPTSVPVPVHIIPPTRSQSPALSDISFAGTRPITPPFCGPSIAQVTEDSSRTRTPIITRQPLKKYSKRSLRLDGNISGAPPGEAIYMTVVQETN
ncbi:putative STE3-like pheromone receptor STE3_Mr3 [Moniliophthora roreri]|uniref:Putative STE3-like pheromone receptor STE3_Mr3 n=1 Tax=Moniliophthora roreri TaxID=221103 RepID=A0A0W0FBM6_MONRR|nr:putative STE3-like pheromone receptor STE3_Mr3 [Moniliophthora roreri]